MNKKGFTLIEMLVVVLIIGILAAIALPQYRKVVEKSKVPEAVITLKYMKERGQEFMLVNGMTKEMSSAQWSPYYPLTNEKLGIELPDSWECEVEPNASSNEVCCSSEWCFDNTSEDFGRGGMVPVPSARRKNKNDTMYDVLMNDKYLYSLFYGVDDVLYCENHTADYCKFIGSEQVEDDLWEM